MTPRRKTAVATLLALGFSVALIAILFFFALFFTSNKALKKVSDDLYLHPFTVNAAAANLKTSLYQMRSEALMLVLMKMRNEDWENASMQIDAHERAAYRNLDIIKSSFLGDMKRVELLERNMKEWHAIRSDILLEVKQGKYDAAHLSVKELGTPKFNQILLQVDYVLAFSQNKAAQFVQEADDKSNAMIKQGQWLALTIFGVVLTTAVVVVWRVRFLHHELLKQATMDSLTGTHNRRNFMSLVQEEEYRARRYGLAFSLAVVDLDHFKKVNDNYGHHAGDAVLKNFCTIAQSCLRQSDALGRLGGEEFGILMPNTPVEDALLVIERVRQAVADSVVREGAAEIRVTGSFGLATFALDAVDTDLDALFKAADQALYRAKEQGRNQVVACSADRV